MRKSPVEIDEDFLADLTKYDPIVAQKLFHDTNKDAMEVCEGSYIEFYKNGEKEEQKFVDMYEGVYHAAISLYMNARCRVNFGKSPFIYKPKVEMEEENKKKQGSKES